MNRIQLLLLLRIEFVKIVTTIVRPGATAGTASELLVLLAGTAAHTGRQRDAATSSGRRINQLLLLLLLWQISVFRYASAAYRSTASFNTHTRKKERRKFDEKKGEIIISHRCMR